MSKRRTLEPSEIKKMLQDIRHYILWDQDGDYATRAINVDALEDAIALVSLTIPRAPELVNLNNDIDGNYERRCPHCGATLLLRTVNEDDEVYKTYYNRSKFCDCGQRLDWSEVED